MTQRRLILVAAVLILVLAGCSSTPTPSAADADLCNRHAAWVFDGSPSDQEVRVARDLESMLTESSSEALVSAVRALEAAIAGDEPDAVAEASDELAATCDQAGWTPAEG